MLTICARCRTPYDRRQAAGDVLPSLGSAAQCEACVSGELVVARAPRVLAAVAATQPGAAPERLVLPIAS